MSVITKVLKQQCVYWAPISETNFEELNRFDTYGQVKPSEPIEIKCRWDGFQELITAPDGSDFVTRYKVMTDRDVELGGYLFFGDLDDLSSEEREDPKLVPLAYEIKKFGKTPNFKATESLRQAYL